MSKRFDFKVPDHMAKPRMINMDPRRFIFQNIDDDYDHVFVYYFEPTTMNMCLYGKFLRNELFDLDLDLMPLAYEPAQTYVKQTFKFDRDGV